MLSELLLQNLCNLRMMFGISDFSGKASLRYKKKQTNSLRYQS
jgi:hypothetical protein